MVAAWLAGWLIGRLAGRLFGWLAGDRLADWLDETGTWIENLMAEGLVDVTGRW